MIESLKRYRVKVNYKRTDNLKPDVLPNGTQTEVFAAFIIEEGDYKGDWAMQPFDGFYWIPSSEVEIIKEHNLS